MKSNAKRLYDHYVNVGYTAAAENMLVKYPEFKEVPKPKTSKKEEKTLNSE